MDASFTYLQESLAGYDHVFKNKTGDKVEGVMILWKRVMFEHVETLEGEYEARGEDRSGLLKKNAVYLIVVLRHRDSGRFVLVCTTHISFTKRRGDMQLA